MGIDKLDVRIPRSAWLSGAFMEACRDLWPQGLPTNYYPTKHYRQRWDLRRLGFQAILHCQSRLNGDSKLELLGVGERLFPAVLDDIGRIVDVNPAVLAIMRIDFAVDVPGVPVAWFRRHTLIPSKQHRAEYGTQYSEVHGKRIETLYFGKRPNFYRIYDKVLEQQQAGARRHQQTKSLAPSCCPGTTLTRVERQCGGGKVPCEMGTIGDLTRNKAKFDPFSALKFMSMSQPRLSPEECSGVIEFLARRGLRYLIEELGLDGARKELNKISSRNAARIFRRYLDTLRETEVPDLHALYVESLKKQFVDDVTL